MFPLPSDERRALLILARQAIVAAVAENRVLDLPDPQGTLRELAGVFVTLRRRGRLRGCIGQLEAAEPMARAVAYCAVSAALADPRFEPVRPVELGELEIELSILSALEGISPEQIEVGKHGLVVSRLGRRGVLLPQVATEYSWGRERFLEETCQKAGLERNAWRDPATRIQAFTADVFSEADFSLERSTGPKLYSNST